MLFRTVNEQKKDLWRVIVTHFYSAQSLSKSPFKFSCPYILNPSTISLFPFSWPTFPLAHLGPRPHCTICGSDWLILFSIFHAWPLTSSGKPANFQIWFILFPKMEATALLVNFFPSSRIYIRLEVVNAVTMNITVFWDMMPHNMAGKC